MKGSVQIAKFFGIPVQVHWTFVLIFVYVFYEGMGNALSWMEMGWITIFVLALFACVVLHEYGHALTARRFGVDTRDIILSPIGGVARLDRLPEQPMHEFLVALAGPMVNIVIGVVLSFIPLLSSEESRHNFRSFFMQIIYPQSNFFVSDPSPFEYFLFGLVALNIVLAVFNLLPAFPMDGGRVLRALLSLRLGRLRATQIAVYIGQLIAVLLVGYGLWNYHYITALIGLFVFVTASNEYRMVKLDRVLEDHQVREVLRPQFTKLYTQDPLSLAMGPLSQGIERNFLVFDEWQNLVGILPEERILEGAQKEQEGTRAPILAGQLASPRFESILASDSLKSLFPKIQWKGYWILPVYEKGRLVGVVDKNALNNFISLQVKLENRNSPYRFWQGLFRRERG
ncbi:MAG: site-2 protease family protein [Lewinellaceae bacterium]|nr:site-2 protease family protein [Phaeodactylibacter sp.]MCB0615215.1 site-2 protease family protein [Phaeodactylibacter sp.]MCB9348117.1 site-2 protease family protein [Lewinellaceae bacterium]